MYFWSYSFAWPLFHWPLVLLSVLLLVGFLPSVIAFVRRHHNRYAILVLNVLLGWTVVGWAVALVWSLTAVWRKTGPATYET
ncbi:MAG: superinfection immunity protein [Xanthobacteraceae bacterium]